MSEPTTPILTSGGLTVFGVATGLDPVLLVAGFIGCWWYNSYIPTLTVGQRFSSGIIAALVAAWATPPVIAWVASTPVWPHAVSPMIAGWPLALVIGFLTHKVIGPSLLRVAEKKAEDLA